MNTTPANPTSQVPPGQPKTPAVVFCAPPEPPLEPSRIATAIAHRLG